MHAEAVRVRLLYGAKLSVHIIHDMHTMMGSTVNVITHSKMHLCNCNYIFCTHTCVYIYSACVYTGLKSALVNVKYI